MPSTTIQVDVFTTNNSSMFLSVSPKWLSNRGMSKLILRPWLPSNIFRLGRCQQFRNVSKVFRHPEQPDYTASCCFQLPILINFCFCESGQRQLTTWKLKRTRKKNIQALNIPFGREGGRCCYMLLWVVTNIVRQLKN